jgi:hypothetical protein
MMRGQLGRQAAKQCSRPGGKSMQCVGAAGQQSKVVAPTVHKLTTQRCVHRGDLLVLRHASSLLLLVAGLSYSLAPGSSWCSN